MRKKILSVISCLSIFVLGVVHAGAWNYSGNLFSAAGTANIWNTQANFSLPYSDIYNHVCGGDVEVLFYYNNVGLQTSFSTYGNRYAYFEIYEDDLIFPDVFARSYQGKFAVINGFYRPINYIETNTTSNTLEDDGSAELYMRYFITTLSGDTSTSIPANLISYEYRII